MTLLGTLFLVLIIICCVVFVSLGGYFLWLCIGLWDTWKRLMENDKDDFE